MLGSLANSTLVLGIQEHLLLIEACTLWKCFLMRSLKHVLRNAVNTYSSLSGLYLVRNTKSFLSFCLWFTTLSPICFQIWCKLCSMEAEVAELERHHQHCSSRENFPSDKSLNQLPCFEAQKPHPCTLIKHLQKTCSQHSEWRGMLNGPWGKLELITNAQNREFSKEGKGNNKRTTNL